MRLHGLIRTGLCLALLLPATIACGPKQDAKTVVDPQSGSMPAGQEWRGVYYSQLYGFLHLTDESGNITGAWRTTAGDKWGEMFGEAKGDILKYTWKEHTIGAIGADAVKEGAGYFRYTVPKEGEAAEIQGEWGLGESNSGQTWKAVKQKNMEPDPKSVRPSEIEGRVGGGGWDDDKPVTEESPDTKPEGDKAEGDKSEGDNAEGDKGGDAKKSDKDQKSKKK